MHAIKLVYIQGYSYNDDFNNEMRHYLQSYELVIQVRAKGWLKLWETYGFPVKPLFFEKQVAFEG